MINRLVSRISLLGAGCHHIQPYSLGGGRMSFKALAWAFDQELNNPEKSVLIALAYRDNHDEPHGCYPSIPRIAKDCGISERTVQRSIAFLESKKLVRLHRRDNRSTFYSMPSAWVVSHSHHPGVTQSPPLVSHSHPEPKDLTINKNKEHQCLKCLGWFPKSALRRHQCAS